MKPSFRGFFYLLLLACLTLVPFSASVQGAQGQSGPTIEYFGLNHTALGRAELSLVDESLVVSNIGPGGLDGVFVELNQATQFRMTWQDVNDSGASNTTLLNFVVFGSTGGEEDILSSIFLEQTQRDVRTPTMFIETDFRNLGATAHTFEVYNDGVLVDTATSEFVFTLVTPMRGTQAAWPDAMTLLGGNGQPMTYIMEWDDAQEDVVFTFRVRDNFQISGDELRLIATNALPVVNLTGAEVRVGDLPEFTILSETFE